MKKNKIFELDIDSDVLRSITFLDILINIHGVENIDVSKVKDALLCKHFKSLLSFYKAIKADKIRIVIEEAIYQENKHLPSVLSFIKNNAYFPDVNIVNYQERIIQSRKLAHAYCAEYTYQGEKFPAPMQETYNAEMNTLQPPTDAHIMGQATVGGRCLVTANSQHFIYNKKTSNFSNDRSKGIVQINILNGYYSTDEQGNMLVPKPISISNLGNIIKNGVDNLFVVESNEKIVKADLIL